MKTPANLIGPQIKQLRILRGWSQATLALKLQLRGLDVCRDIIAQIERQTHTVRDRDIPTFAKVLGVEVSSLFAAPLAAAF
jgi:transcriptional regulator with XRE-family HTH domain